MTAVISNRLSRAILRDGPATVQVDQVARGVLRDGEAAVRVGQVRRVVFGAAGGTVRVAQAWRAILRSQRDSPYPHFPVRLFNPPSLGVRLVGGELLAGESLSGEAAAEALAAGGAWAMTFGEVPLWDREKVLAWRSFVTACDGGAMPCIVPLWDRLYQPFVASAYAGDTTFGSVIWRDTAVFDQPEAPATVATTAPAQASELAIAFTGPRAPQGGEHLSIYGPRYGWSLYRLTRPIDPEAGTWEIRPPLREWVEAGTPLNFDTPRATMRPDGDLSELVELLRFGKGAATFVESWARYP